MGRNIKQELIFCECGCGESFNRYDSVGRERRYKSGHNWRGMRHKKESLEKMSGKNHYFYRGWFVDKKGYRMIFVSRNNYIPEHRLVWEREHSACLLSWADVHHRDENKLNNVWYNLWAMTNAQHTSLNFRKDTSDWFCLLCPRKGNDSPKWFNYRDGHICYGCYQKGYRKRKKNGIPTGRNGELNPAWKGNDVSYNALHQYIRKHLPAPEHCQMCGEKKKLLLANISGEYKRDLTDWQYLCARCHRLYDQDRWLESYRRRNPRPQAPPIRTP